MSTLYQTKIEDETFREILILRNQTKNPDKSEWEYLFSLIKQAEAHVIITLLLWFFLRSIQERKGATQTNDPVMETSIWPGKITNLRISWCSYSTRTRTTSLQISHADFFQKNWWRDCIFSFLHFQFNPLNSKQWQKRNFKHIIAQFTEKSISLYSEVPHRWRKLKVRNANFHTIYRYHLQIWSSLPQIKITA